MPCSLVQVHVCTSHCHTYDAHSRHCVMMQCARRADIEARARAPSTESNRGDTHIFAEQSLDRHLDSWSVAYARINHFG